LVADSLLGIFPDPNASILEVRKICLNRLPFNTHPWLPSIVYPV
jgi:hypothetical protein